MCTRISSPPTCARTDTTWYASTVPMAWICSGMLLRSTAATATGTGGRFGGCLDSALPPEQAVAEAASSSSSTPERPRVIRAPPSVDRRRRDVSA